MGGAAAGAAIGGITQGLSSFLQGKLDRRGQKRAQRFAREVAQNQIQWRVQDLKAAGINPILAAGAGLGGGGGGSSPGVASAPSNSGLVQAGAAAGSAISKEVREKKLLTEQANSANAQAENARQAALKNKADANEADRRTRQLDAEFPGVEAMEKLYSENPQFRFWKEFGPVGGATATGIQGLQSHGINAAKKAQGFLEKFNNDRQPWVKKRDAAFKNFKGNAGNLYDFFRYGKNKGKNK